MSAAEGARMRQRGSAIGAGLAGLGLALIVGAAVDAQGPGPTGTVRLAFVPQVIVRPHSPGHELRAALDGGVVDRTVFAWQRGLIERKSLVLKPIRLVTGDEARGLGARGPFQLGAIRPSRGASAWVEVDVTHPGGDPDDRVVLEVGGEKFQIRQILGALFVAPPGEGLEALRLSPRALIPGAGVPVVAVSVAASVAEPGRPATFRGARGVEFLVARSPIRTRVDVDVTTNGFADRAESPLDGPDDWRDGDRVFVRLSAATLRAGGPAIVMVWKDRTYADPDPHGGPLFP